MTRTIMDLDMDALAQCTSYLDLQDVSNMSMTSKYFKSVASSDPVWRCLFRKRWPFQMSSCLLPPAGVKEAYIARHIASHQFKFSDPWSSQFIADRSPRTHILLDKDDIIVSLDSDITMKIDAFQYGKDTMITLRNHKAKITCMRLFSLHETSLCRNEAQNKDNFLVTSSSDHTIRLWWKGCCQRCFKGHNGPVTTLADRLLGETGTGGKVLASGGEDGTVRLWSLMSSGKRGQNSLKTTFYGHEKPIAFLSVARHKASLLVSISNDAKVRVWDANRSSASHSSGCVGMASAPSGHSRSREPVAMKCDESLTYIASGSLVTAIDLRTMKKAFTSALHLGMHSFEMVPSKFLICTDGLGTAKLWDTRRSQEKPEPVTEFEHFSHVSHLHMDPYKVVVGSGVCGDVNVWDPMTGMLVNSFPAFNTEDVGRGISAMAIDGCRFVAAGGRDNMEYINYKDYTHASSLISSSQVDAQSRFWEPQCQYDSDD